MKISDKYLQFEELLKYDIVHCITLKGIDFSIYLNKDELMENYKTICKDLNISEKNIVRPKQNHTDNIRIVDEIGEEYENVDGLITDKKNIFLALGYADCIPLLFFDKERKIVANIHSGWKGTLQKIGKKAVEKMKKEYGSDPKDIICAIGPSIRKCHFEVEEDVKILFEQEFKYTGKINEIITNFPYHVDTVLINKIILKEAGLKEENIIDSNMCTACNNDKLYSYRANQDKARMTAIIGLR